jgi:hypothetical protein
MTGRSNGIPSGTHRDPWRYSQAIWSEAPSEHFHVPNRECMDSVESENVVRIDDNCVAAGRRQLSSDPVQATQPIHWIDQQRNRDRPDCSPARLAENQIVGGDREEGHFFSREEVALTIQQHPFHQTQHGRETQDDPTAGVSSGIHVEGLTIRHSREPKRRSRLSDLHHGPSRLHLLPGSRPSEIGYRR